mmetsp:Transcript_15681/g.31244  ORF Transcript_15681/g.31244 Transcript_15681/m.31244 type:complete len:272 (-) Transcript_15681:22-837(-)|eukprot:CAMPEP_0194308526 /NCGR_PEP_ID=MMETSP0171-20130528/5498_1 /TAXON_ID=218684 /ORGANISM="Corethron pennatum, Strain L29A3" /LENGTH=271 /DNA_ID=CAMNT_0039061213 /DNA_START=42 /DNA_END=857 /DNA_ORIENTATION=-
MRTIREILSVTTLFNASTVWPFTITPSSLHLHTAQTKSSRNMFTGIVEEMGSVVSLVERDDLTLWDGSVGSGTELVVAADVVLEGAYLGCSISVSGVCLTATMLDEPGKFTVGLSPETLRLTHLGRLQTGDAVNLERASEIGGRNSGHFVQGHIDGMGDIIDRWIDGDSLFIKVKVSPEVIKYIVPKGFVAIDGTSLTVCEVDPGEGWFTFMLVEYTQKKIVIPAKPVGAPVNIEVDVLGKYAESALANITPRIAALEAQVKDLEQKLMEK